MAAEATLFFSPEISKNEIRVEVHNVKIKRCIRRVTCSLTVLVFAIIRKLKIDSVEKTVN